LLPNDVSMPCTRLPARNVVQIEHPPDLKGYMPRSFDEGKVAARVGDPRELDQVAVVESHVCAP
jgi:hypothetical protein